MDTTLSYKWYALYTKSRQEKKVYSHLVNQGITAFLPLEKRISQWSDRKKKVELPIIPSYIFVRSSEKEYYDILSTSGAVRYVTFEGKATPIPDWQIEAFKELIKHNLTFKCSSDQFLKGEEITIDSGVLRGYKGEIVNGGSKQKHLIIRIENTGYSLIIENPLKHNSSNN